MSNIYHTNIPIKKGQYFGVSIQGEDGEPIEAGWIAVSIKPDSGGAGDPILFPALNPALAGGIGTLVAYWSCLEGALVIMTSLLSDHNGSVEPIPREFSKKLRRFKLEINTAFSAHPDVIAHVSDQILTLVARAKLLRDDINHSQIMGFHSDDGPCLRFLSDTYGRKTKRYFHLKDFERVAGDIARACGRLNQLANDPDSVQVASPSKLALRRVLDADRWNLAIEKALRLQP